MSEPDGTRRTASIAWDDAQAVPLSDVLQTLLELSPPADQLTVPLPEGVETAAVAEVIALQVHRRKPKRPVTVAELLERSLAWTRAAAFLAVAAGFPWRADDVDFEAALERCNPALHALVADDDIRRRGELASPGALDQHPFHDMVPIDAASGAPDASDAPDAPDIAESARTGFVCDAESSLVGDQTVPAAAWATPYLRGNCARLHAWATQRLTARGAPWFDGRSGMVIAGGFAASAALGYVQFPSAAALPRVPAGSDVDIFLCITRSAASDGRRGWSAARFREIGDGLVRRVVAALASPGVGAAAPTVDAWVCGASDHVVNVIVSETDRFSDEVTSAKFQLILCAMETPAHVVHGFDISLCKVVYDGSRVRATEGALRALLSGVELFDQTKFSASAVHRYAKYARRYRGLRLYLPGVPQAAVDALLAHFARFDDAWEKEKEKEENEQENEQGRAHAPPLSGVALMLFALSASPKMRGTHERHDARQSDYTDPGFTARLMGIHRIHHIGPTLSSVHNALAQLDSLAAHVTRRTVTDGVFTGAFNPVDINIYAGLDRFLDLAARSPALRSSQDLAA